jgi:thiol:disulfide interchange protein
MKKWLSQSLAAFAAVMCSSGMYAQILDPVKWSWKAEQTGDGEYNITFTANIDKGWYLYSQFINEGGPIATSFMFEKNADVEVVGKASEKGEITKEGLDPIFEMQIKKFAGKADFVQRVRVKKNTVLKGALEYMTCDDERCLPPDEKNFEFSLKGADKTSGQEVLPPGGVLPTDDGSEQLQTGDAQVTIPELIPGAAGDEPLNRNRFGEPLTECVVGDESQKQQGILSIIILGFLGGFLALLTPCVFPMIPLTVSFFTKRSETKSKGKSSALLYSFFIVLIYFLLAVPFLIFDISPDTLSEIATGVTLNIVFFIIFVVFAFSFFGYYEIQLPASIANKADSASALGGVIGIFFMAVTLAIVSFSCTGPILGTLLVGTLTTAGGKLNLVAGMTSFGLALALPFGLFALFPQMLNKLPKSGGWMNTVKVTLGFAELALAIKFLSNADLVAHWGLLKREVFLVLWMLCGLGLMLYYLNILRFPHYAPEKKISPTKWGLSILLLAFIVYTGSGLFGKDLHLFSGFPPPKFYSLIKQENDCPHNLECFHNDYEGAIAHARKVNKPVLVDFTGWACVNCRKMEENVWIDPEVYNRISQNYVLLSLYVDDKEMLPESEQYISKFSGKKIKTIGNKWSDMQASYFNSNSQPYYVLISGDEKLLTLPVGYTPDKRDYIAFLDCGLNAFKAKSQMAVMNRN